jgi:hypothetical protein
LAGILICLIGIIGVVLIADRRGRGAGLALAAFFAAFVAFFVMPPVFSFRIDRPYDLATLVGYGLSSLAAVRLFRRGTRREVPSDNPTVSLTTTMMLGSSAVSTSLLKSQFSRNEEESELYLDPKISKVIADVFELANESTTIAGRTSVHSAYQPGLRKVWIVAQRLPGVPLPHSMIIGLRDEDCQRIVCPDWPANCSVTWFDNRAERVYQISIQQ